MNYKKSPIFLLFVAFALASCNYSPGKAAKPPQSQLSADLVTTPLTYTIATYNSSVMGGSRTYEVSLSPGYAQ